MSRPVKKLQTDQAVIQKNRFAALDNFSSDSESDSEVEEVITPLPVALPLPVVAPIKMVEQDQKVDLREFTIVRNTRGKQVRTDKEGWTSVQWSKPQFVDSDTESVESELQIKKELEMEECEPPDASDEDIPPIQTLPDTFPSLLNRGSINAMAWAEKIKQSLEKAESTGSKKAPGIQKTDEFVSGLGRVSFFS